MKEKEMITTILLSLLIVMTLVVVIQQQQVKAYLGQREIEGAEIEDAFNKACMQEAHLSHVPTSINTDCPIAMKKMFNDLQLLQAKLDAGK